MGDFTAPLAASTTVNFYDPNAANANAGGGGVNSDLRISMSTVTAAGAPVRVLVQHLTDSGAVDSAYAGTVSFTSTDFAAVLPGAYTFTAEDAGSKVFDVTFATTGIQQLTLNDTASAAATVSIIVAPGALARITVAGHPAMAGQDMPVVVTFFDTYGNIKTDQSGSLGISSTDPNAILPSGVSISTADSGTITVEPIIFRGTGLFALTLSDLQSRIMGTTQVVVAANPVVALHLDMPLALPAGIATHATVTAVDNANRIVSGYLGTVALSCTDPNATFASSITFTAADAGQKIIPAAVSFSLAGPQQLSAQDIYFSAIAGHGTVQVNVPWLRTQMNHAMCMDSAGTTGSLVRLQACSATNLLTQQWQMVGSLVREGTGRCLSGTPGNQLTVQPCNTADVNQQFVRDPTTSRMYNAASNQCIDLYGARTTDGTQIRLYTCNGTAAQSWPSSDTPMVLRNQNNLRCLDVANQLPVNGANASISVCGTADSQQWRFTNGQIRTSAKLCLQADSVVTGALATIDTCAASAANGWSYDPTMMRLYKTDNASLCLTQSQPGTVGLQTCVSTNSPSLTRQQWLLDAVMLQSGANPTVCVDIVSNALTMQNCDATTATQYWQFFDGSWKTVGNICGSITGDTSGPMAVTASPCSDATMLHNAAYDPQIVSIYLGGAYAQPDWHAALNGPASAGTPLAVDTTGTTGAHSASVDFVAHAP